MLLSLALGYGSFITFRILFPLFSTYFFTYTYILYYVTLAPIPLAGYEYLMKDILPACSLLAQKRVDTTFGIMDAKGVGLSMLTGNRESRVKSRE